MSTNQPGKPRIRLIDEAGTDTTEAHSANQPGKPRVKFIDETADDDSTEGHPIRVKPDDEGTEGHGMKGRP